jgi:hypothetical protein
MIDYHARIVEHDYHSSAQSEPRRRGLDSEPGALFKLCEYQVNKLILMPSGVPERRANRGKQQEQCARKRAKKFHTTIERNLGS